MLKRIKQELALQAYYKEAFKTPSKFNPIDANSASFLYQRNKEQSTEQRATKGMQTLQETKADDKFCSDFKNIQIGNVGNSRSPLHHRNRDSDEQISIKRQQRAQKKAHQIAEQQRLANLSEEDKFLYSFRKQQEEMAIFRGTPIPNDQELDKCCKDALISWKQYKKEEEIVETEENTTTHQTYQQQLPAESPYRHRTLQEHPMCTEYEEPSQEIQEKENFYKEKLQEWEDYISDADDLYEAIDLAWEEKQKCLENIQNYTETVSTHDYSLKKLQPIVASQSEKKQDYDCYISEELQELADFYNNELYIDEESLSQIEA